ncbi:hypothetical protein BJF90_06375 [Pseudonocardia sp. CNS-004]|nr:hypothetical protein BJF90_06375 [Pseudonocardia sp. CNS-004]
MHERAEPLGGRGAGAERWWSGEEPLLQLGLVLVEQRGGQPALVPEPAEQRALADPGRRDDVVHGHGVDTVLVEQPLGGGEDPDAVARCVGPFRLPAGDGQPAPR